MKNYYLIIYFANGFKTPLKLKGGVWGPSINLENWIKTGFVLVISY